MTKDEILTAIAVFVLLISVMIDWNVYSWLILAGIIVILFAWYFRKKDEETHEIFSVANFTIFFRFFSYLY